MLSFLLIVAILKHIKNIISVLVCQQIRSAVIYTSLYCQNYSVTSLRAKVKGHLNPGSLQVESTSLSLIFKIMLLFIIFAILIFAIFILLAICKN